MSLNVIDIQEWKSDPEQYIIQETTLTADSNLRAASQTLYLGILCAFEGCVCSAVVKRLDFHQTNAFNNQLEIP